MTLHYSDIARHIDEWCAEGTVLIKGHRYSRYNWTEFDRALLEILGSPLGGEGTFAERCVEAAAALNWEIDAGKKNYEWLLRPDGLVLFKIKLAQHEERKPRNRNHETGQAVEAERQG